MDTLPTETLILILKLLSVKDLISFSKISLYYSHVGSDDRLWKDLYESKFTYKNKYSKEPVKGWKHEYKKKVITELSQNSESDSIDYLLSISLLSYNKTYNRAAETAIKKNKPKILEKLLKFCSVDSTLDELYNQCYSRFITLAVTKNSNECVRVLLDNGADITYSNTGVLLMGSKHRTLSLNGFIGNFKSLEMSYLFLDTMLSQITFFLCSKTGNESNLQEFLKTKRGSFLINKRTGMWDYGTEVLRLTDLFANNRDSKLGQPRNNNLFTIKNQHLKTASKLQEQQQQLMLENYEKMFNVRLSQFKMIEKTLIQFTQCWKSEWCSFTPLHWASFGGHLGNIKLLIKHGAKIDTLTSHNKSAAALALENNHTQCHQFLEKQMSRLIKDSDLDVLYKKINEGDSLAIMKFINTYLFERNTQTLEKSITISLLFMAIECDQPRILSMLFQALSINQISDPDGNTPIHYSAALNRLECLKVALEKGFINKLNKSHQTPLMMACMNGHLEIVQYLLEQNPQIDSKDFLYNTALHYSTKYPEITSLLLEHYADPLETNIFGMNCIHLASNSSGGLYSGCPETLEILSKHLVNRDGLQRMLNQPDINGDTPFHLASKPTSRPDVANHLYSILSSHQPYTNSVNLNLKNRYQITPREYSSISDSISSSSDQLLQDIPNLNLSLNEDKYLVLILDRIFDQQFRMEYSRSIIIYDSQLLLSYLIPSLSNSDLLESLELSVETRSYRSCQLLLNHLFTKLESNNNNNNLNNNNDKEIYNNCKTTCKNRNRELVKSLLQQYDIPPEILKRLHSQLGFKQSYVSSPPSPISPPQTTTTTTIITTTNTDNNDEQIEIEDPVSKKSVPNGKDKLCSQCGLYTDDLVDHSIICLGKLHTCPNSSNGCSAKLSRFEVGQHLQSSCCYLHCFQCDSMFNRDEFIQHIYQHESESWEVCPLCQHHVKGFKSSYRDEITHIKQSSANCPIPRSSESLHLSHECKEHFIR
eukprot:gene11872-14522_t